MFEGKKKNWMIVLHRHHVGSTGHKSEIIVDYSKSGAEAYALLKAAEWQRGGVARVTGMAIELPDIVQVIHQPN